jgi:hypothetical protein
MCKSKGHGVKFQQDHLISSICPAFRAALCQIPTGPFDLFHLSNPSSRTVILKLAQPLTEMSIRNLSVGKARPTRKSDFTAICEHIVEKVWEPRHIRDLWAFMVCYRNGFTLYAFFVYWRYIKVILFLCLNIEALICEGLWGLMYRPWPSLDLDNSWSWVATSLRLALHCRRKGPR